MAGLSEYPISDTADNALMPIELSDTKEDALFADRLRQAAGNLPHLPPLLRAAARGAGENRTAVQRRRARRQAEVCRAVCRADKRQADPRDCDGASFFGNRAL